MFVLPLNLRIFNLLGGLILAATAAILLTLWYGTSSHAQKQLERDLMVGESVTREVMMSREQLLFSAADVLTQDFGFKSALASQDFATISSALNNHKRRINADLMIAIDLDGSVIAESSSQRSSSNTPVDQGLIAQALSEGGATALVIIDGRLYQSILLLVEAPQPIAVTMLGFEINETLLAELKQITNLDVSFRVSAPNAENVVSSLKPAEVSKALAPGAFSGPGKTPLLDSDDIYISHQFVFQENFGQKQIDVILSDKQSTWYSDFSRLIKDTFLIAILCFVVALVLGLVFANNLTRPLSSLVAWAKNISVGEYLPMQDIGAKSKEINKLAEAFEAMQSGIQSREEKIQYQASHDLLTRLYNRYEIGNIIEKRLHRSEEFQILSFKAIGFREVNTAFGMQSGDACMLSLANRIEALDGLAARLNGSEIVLLPAKPLRAEDVIALREQLEVPHTVDNIAIKVRLAVGSINLPADTEDLDATFRYLSIAVDEALERSERYCAYAHGMEEERMKRLAILRELENALVNDDRGLDLFYQPKLDVSSGKILKAEALIRWNSSTLGFVPPDEFIPIAEKAGLIGEVTRWVTQRAITDITRWRERGLYLKVAINLSVHDVANEELMNELSDRLNASDLNDGALEFEITESDLMSDPDTAITLLKRFRDQGYELAIDDFGTGYSSLAYLKNMPVSELKIDKSFVLKLEHDRDDQLIVRSIIELSKRFELKVVAEGVESLEALTLLKDWGCDFAQGYFISRPTNADDLYDWLEENKETEWV